MSDLSPLHDDDEALSEAEVEQPKRKLTLDDGELPFEADIEKPKKRPPSRLWRKTYIPIPLLLAICALMICSAVLLLGSSFAASPLLCRIPSLCSDRTAAEVLSVFGRDPRPPLDMPHVQHRSVYDATTDSYSRYEVTITPVQYTAPRCDPNGDYQNSLMFTMEASDNTEIFVMSADSSRLCRVTQNLIEERQVDWSPDRKQIAFMSQRTGDNALDIYTMNFDGTNIVNLTQDQRDDFAPVWSPDGTKIAYSSHDASGPSGQIYVVNADGSNRRNLTPDATLAGSPSWSPDGTRIAYVAGTKIAPNNIDVYMVQVSTGQIIQLTSDVVTESNPVWMPDGTELIVTAYTVTELGKPSSKAEQFVLNLKDQSLERFPLTPYHVDDLSFSPDQHSIAYISTYGLLIADLRTNQTRTLPTDHRIISTISWR